MLRPRGMSRGLVEGDGSLFDFLVADCRSKIKLQCWDTAGQADVRGVVKSQNMLTRTYRVP